jgi:hypothetical protein
MTQNDPRMTMPSPLRTSPNKVHSNSLFLEATMLPGQRQGQGKFLGPMVIRMDAWKQQVLQTAASLEIDIPLHYLALPTTEVECERPLACPVCTLRNFCAVCCCVVPVLGWHLRLRFWPPAQACAYRAHYWRSPGVEGSCLNLSQLCTLGTTFYRCP